MSILEKAALEDFRRRQFAQPHPALSCGFPRNSSVQSSFEADKERVVLHFDVDAFYAQCEEVRQPSLRSRPMGVTQKYLIVTCNYPARAVGVTKLMSIVEAKKKCPDIVLINGEDLTPYRHASKRILAVLERFGTAERLGMDEVLLDVTSEVDRREEQGMLSPIWHGHVHRPQDGVVQGCEYRPMDLRAPPKALNGSTEILQASEDLLAPWDLRLKIGSAIAAEARTAIKAETGFRCSAGIACNRMLAKLISGIHKPDDQTILLPQDAAAFVHNLPVRAFPGVGWKLEAQLKEAGVEKACQLLEWSLTRLSQHFGDRAAALLHSACRGLDSTPVAAKGPPRSVTVEDSFKSCTSLSAAQHILQLLAPDLLARVCEEHEENRRLPASLTIKWRFGGQSRKWGRSSASCRFPPAALPSSPDASAKVDAVVKAAMGLLKGHLPQDFSLNLLNLGATNFSDAAGSVSQLGPTLARFLGKRKLESPSNPVPATLSAGDAGGGGRLLADANTRLRRDYGAAPCLPVITKRQERALREAAAVSPPQPTAAVPLSPAPPPVLAYTGCSPATCLLSVGAPTGMRSLLSPATPPTLLLPVPPPGSSNEDLAGCGVVEILNLEAVADCPADGSDCLGRGPEKLADAARAILTANDVAQILSADEHAGGPARGVSEAPGLTGARSHAAPNASAGSPPAWGLGIPHDASAAFPPHATLLLENSSRGSAPHMCGGPCSPRHVTASRSAEDECGGAPWMHVCGEHEWASDADEESFWDDLDDSTDFLHGTDASPDPMAGSRIHNEPVRPPAEQGSEFGRQGAPADAAMYDTLPQKGRGEGCGGPKEVVQPGLGHVAEHRRGAGNEWRHEGEEARVAGLQGQTLAAGVAVVKEHAGRSEDGTAARGRERVILHVDVDAFYCSVERLDEPALRGRPLAVTQFNRGGFVSVSHEARAAGIRCGDGVGDAGRAAIAWLRERGALSIQEALQRCPTLVIRPMRTDRYRQVANEVLQHLQSFLPDSRVEKASYDDFYIDITEASQKAPSNQEASPQGVVHVVGNTGLESLNPCLLRGANMAQRVQHHLDRELGLPVSCGVARTKLLARLVSPLNKPSGVTVLPDDQAVPFLKSQSLCQIPQLRGKLGESLQREFSLERVEDLAGVSWSELVAKFGSRQAQFLASLPCGGPNAPVRERGPPKVLLCERSFPPVGSVQGARNALCTIAASLVCRLEKEARPAGLQVNKLRVSWREGYGNVITRSTTIPTPLLAALRTTPPPSPAAGAEPMAARAASTPPASSGGQEIRPLSDGIVDVALALLREEAQSFSQITRIALGVTFHDKGPPGRGLAGALITSFLQLQSPALTSRSRGPISPSADLACLPSRELGSSPGGPIDPFEGSIPERRHPGCQGPPTCFPDAASKPSVNSLLEREFVRGREVCSGWDDHVGEGNSQQVSHWGSELHTPDSCSGPILQDAKQGCRVEMGGRVGTACPETLKDVPGVAVTTHLAGSIHASLPTEVRVPSDVDPTGFSSRRSSEGVRVQGAGIYRGSLHGQPLRSRGLHRLLPGQAGILAQLEGTEPEILEQGLSPAEREDLHLALRLQAEEIRSVRPEPSGGLRQGSSRSSSRRPADIRRGPIDAFLLRNGKPQ
eukprot:jgi/Botrbrau1/17214/Bobra.0620s0004.1